MQFVWEHRLGLRSDMRTCDGRPLRVIDQGRLNPDAGPDFFNASVQIGDETWAGNVEIHVRASDWLRHGHQNDRAYDSVILHVVLIDDTQIRRPDGSIIPQVTIRCSPEAATRCNALVGQAARQLPCAPTVRALHPIYVTDWLTALAVERLYRKSDAVLAYVRANGGYWEGAAYVTLARGLGFGLNSEPFEVLAKNVPLNILCKHRDDLTAVEAILFGQAGLIPDPSPDEDPYLTALRREYRFLREKFQLMPLPLSWKMSKTRPQNFPHRRLAMLCELIHRDFKLMGALTEARTLDDIRALLDISLQGFWVNRYTFADRSSGNSSRALGRRSVDTLVINVAVPLLHARAVERGDLDMMERCVDLLQQLPPEDNSVVRLFADAGIEARDAFTTQALVQLRREYCEKRKCIYCRFGHRMLSTEIQS